MAESKYPSDWDQRRREVYQRDRYTCQNCGVRSEPGNDIELHAHHIVPKSRGGTHNTSNLQTLCENCHKAVHSDVQAPQGDGVVDTDGLLEGLIRGFMALSVALLVYFVAATVWIYLFDIVGLGMAGDILGLILGLSPAVYTNKHLS